MIPLKEKQKWHPWNKKHISLMGIYRTPRKMRFLHELRENPTEAELVLKKRLRLKRDDPEYLRFKFQYIVLGFILDFYFSRARVCVEIDGGYHRKIEQKEKDNIRTAALNKAGIKVIRFTNDEVINKLEWVVNRIYWFLSINWPNCPEWLKEYRISKVDNNGYVVAGH
jgi:very-short-patch-repair endonuclease